MGPYFALCEEGAMITKKTLKATFHLKGGHFAYPYVQCNIQVKAHVSLEHRTDEESIEFHKDRAKNKVLHSIYGRMLAINRVMYRNVLAMMPEGADVKGVSDLIIKTLPMTVEDLDRELTDSQKMEILREEGRVWDE